MINTIIGAVGGFLLGAVIVFVLEFLEANMVRRQEDIERMTDLRVLASVPAE
jgi:capsular polysaccharide biosynthesis protein